MALFTILFIELLIATVIFYIVMFSFIFYWHLIKITYVIVPLIFAFEFFAAGFLVISLISIVVSYLPQILILWQ